MAVRHPRRRAMRERVAATVPSDNPLPLFGKFLADEAIDRAVAERARTSGGTNVSRAVSDLVRRSEEHTSELQSLMRTSYAVFCLKKKIKTEKKILRQQTESQNDT